MLVDKELKKQKQQVDKIEAEWSKAQKDLVRAKVAVSNAEAYILAHEQSKNKLLAQCVENGRKFKYNAPVSSQDNVNLMFTKIQKFPEQDKLMLMRKEIKFKKLVFSELPKEFILFKQYNLSSSKMYQNLLALHAVESAHQEDISVEDIYEVAESLAFLPALHTQKSKRQNRPPAEKPNEAPADLKQPPTEDDFLVALEEGWRICSVVSFDNISNTIKAHQLDSISTRAKDDTGRRYWVYSAEEDVETYEEKNILQVRPSITLAKNIKRKDPVFALLNREVIEALVSPLFQKTNAP